MHRISDVNIKKRLEFCEKTLARIQDGSLHLDRIVFSDETSVSCSETKINSRTHRVWVDKLVKISDLPASTIAAPTSGFAVKVMGHVCAPKIGPLPAVMCDPKCKVNQEEYRKLLEQEVVPNIINIEPNLDSAWWQEDNATRHSAKKMREWAKKTFKNMIAWPPQSPDLSSLDYCINHYIKDCIRANLPPISKPEVIRAQFKKVAREMPRDLVGRAIDHWPKRLQECINCGGGTMGRKLQ